MSVLIQDGRRGGHLSWATEAIGMGIANGVVISPFHTPRVTIPYHRAGSTVTHDVVQVGGEAIFDASTHARFLPGTNDLAHYDTWQLWGAAGVGLDTDDRRLEHLERVFGRQRELSVAALAPTLTLDSPLGAAAEQALRTAQLARGLSDGCWQSVAGRRPFWRDGPDLDAYVGQLAALRAPCWMITMVNDQVSDNAPDLADTDAFAGLLRTVHSLSQRSRVIVCHSDFAGLPAIAAGAATVGTGWDRGMRYFDPQSFQLTSKGIQIPASYVTQGGLASVLRRDAADAITRLGEPRATVLRGGPMPADDAAERVHHLRQVHNLTARVSAHGSNRLDRVLEVRNFYEHAIAEFDILIASLPGKIVSDNNRRRWTDEPYAALAAYAQAEGLW